MERLSVGFAFRGPLCIVPKCRAKPASRDYFPEGKLSSLGLIQLEYRPLNAGHPIRLLGLSWSVPN